MSLIYFTVIFWHKNDIVRWFECFQLLESTACFQKNRYDRIMALCILLKNRPSYSYRCKDVLPLFGRNSTSFDTYTRFCLSTSPSQTRVLDFFFFLQLPYLQRYADIAAGKCAPLYNCFNFVDGIIAHICISVLNEKLVFSHYRRVRRVKF